MMYFNSFPKILTTDYNNSGIVLTNIINRIELIPSLLKNPLAFYSYDIQEGDTPEIIANKYYGDSYRYWLVLFSNQIIDPQWNWPLNNSQFNDYLIAKYQQVAANNSTDALTYVQNTVYQYTKTISTTDSTTNQTTTRTIVIDESTYNTLNPPTTTQTFPNGVSVTQEVTKNIVTIYNYELEQNESKRNINLINSIYTSEIEAQFKSLMGA